jgi:hypothetical protein
MKLDALLKNPSPSVIFAMLLFNFLILLGVVYVALDSRDHGARREASFLWALGVGVFPPVFFLYLIVKLVTSRFQPPKGANFEPASQIKNCPYCNASVPEGERLCRSCGRLL